LPEEKGNGNFSLTGDDCQTLGLPLPHFTFRSAMPGDHGTMLSEAVRDSLEVSRHDFSAAEFHCR
jgi:hypothetical protein